MKNEFVVWDWDIDEPCPEGCGMDYETCLKEFWESRFKDDNTTEDEKIKTLSAYHFELIPLRLADIQLKGGEQ